jgi:SAM-dependent methyltransferase
VSPIGPKPTGRTYREFARVYDDVMDDPRPKVARVLELVERHNPAARTLLELGCGTGTILAGLHRFSRTGIDRSPEMLAIAREKVPEARLIEGDIADFHLAERFDVVICVFDTLNHLPTFELWQALFACVKEHLAEGGVLIFDVNTATKIRGLAGHGPWFWQAGETTVAMNVDPPDPTGLSQWNVWLVEHHADGSYSGVHEPIGELGVELDRIDAALTEAGFSVLETLDEEGAPPDADAERVHFAARPLENARA